MESFERARELDLEVDIEIVPDDRDAAPLELVDDLDDPWFARESGPIGDVFEIDPVHPLRRLSAWVRGRLRPGFAAA